MINVLLVIVIILCIVGVLYFTKNIDEDNDYKRIEPPAIDWDKVDK